MRGGDFRRSHEELKVLFDSILKNAGFYTTLEARNIFQGKVNATVLDRHCSQQNTSDSVIPDVLIHNYMDDKGTSRTACMPAILDVKTMQVDKRASYYTVGAHGGRKIKPAVEKKSNNVRNTKCIGRLDTKFAPGDESKPFSSAYINTFATGGVMPIVCGAFGEMNLIPIV